MALFSSKSIGAAFAVLIAGLVVSGCESETTDAPEAPEAPAADVATTDILGEVHFPVSCDSAVQVDFNRAVATLHSFEFAEARGQFEAISAIDPNCAMAHWGVAMTYYHPLWAPPTANDLKAGASAVAAAESLTTTHRESMYISAIGSLYAESDSLPHRERALRYEAGMAALRAAHPDDLEARIFSAVAMLSNVDPRDMTYAVRKSTGAMLEPLFADMPNHPGVAHYIIHSYDVPSLAAKAEDAAHRYLEIATSMPHALHMSGHIFTQLAMWDDSIRANTLAAEAARERASMGAGPQAIMNEIHALDYLVYAYIQTGNLDAAGETVSYVSGHQQLDWTNGVVSFNAGAVPVRWAMERKAWQEAANLGTLETEASASSGYENRNAIAIRHWARAVGAARTGNLEAAEQDLTALAAIATELSTSPDIWARNTSETLRLQAEGWIEHAKGNNGLAIELLRAAAGLEDETDKSGLSPGRILPAREQLADLLMDLGRHEEALVEYGKSLQQAPARLNSTDGQARAKAAMEGA